MTTKKKTSADEKLQFIEELLYKKSEPYTLKELEKIVPKETGIRSQVVKDVLQQLVADNRISGDKLGATNFYWLFPSQAYAFRKRRLEELDKEIEVNVSKKEKLQLEIKASMIGKEDTSERRENSKELSNLAGQVADLDKKLAVYGTKDPELIQKKKDDVKICVQGINVWTDNIFSLKSYCLRTMGLAGDDFDNSFDIPKDLDNVDLKSLSS